MSGPFDYIVRDSSIYQPYYNTALSGLRHPGVFIGIIRKQATMDDDQAQIRYEVEVQYRGQVVVVSCILMTRMGGVYNFEEFAVHGYTAESPINPSMHGGKFAPRAGDVVIVSLVHGSAREGVILGGTQHPARDRVLADDEIGYISEFNGIETKITSEGEYTLTFKGLPLNNSLLDLPPVQQPIVPPQYDPIKSGSMFKFDSDGGITITDAHPVFEQSITIDKSGNTMTVASGDQLSVVLTASSGDLSISALTMEVSATKSMDISTLAFSVEADESVKIKGTQVAIGSDGCELIDTIIKLIDAIGTTVVTSPVGPCNPFSGAPTWPQVIQLKMLLQSIKGSL